MLNLRNFLPFLVSYYNTIGAYNSLDVIKRRVIQDYHPLFPIFSCTVAFKCTVWERHSSFWVFLELLLYFVDAWFQNNSFTSNFFSCEFYDHKGLITHKKNCTFVHLCDKQRPPDICDGSFYVSSIRYERSFLVDLLARSMIDLEVTKAKPASEIVV